MARGSAADRDLLWVDCTQESVRGVICGRGNDRAVRFGQKVALGERTNLMSRMTSLQCCGLLAFSIANAGSHAQTHIASQPTTIACDELAANVLRAYRSAKYLKFTLEVTSGEHRLSARVEMAPER